MCFCASSSKLFADFQRIKSWNPVTNVSEVILNTGEFGTAFTKTSVIAATKDHVFVGGFSGELVVKRLDADSVPARLKSYSADPNCITNHMFPFEDADGMGAKLLISSNDCTLRLYDVRGNRMRSLVRFPYALNASEPQPLSHSGGSSSSSRLIACVGDSRKVRLLDGQSLAEVAALPAHDDFAFSCSWSPCGRFLASGSQDCTAKIFDVRQLNRPLHTFTAQMAPIRRVCFSPCGRFLAVMEADDFVHVYSTQRAYREGQIIDFFGECSGIAWDPQGDSLYIGCSGAENGGIMEFRVSE